MAERLIRAVEATPYWLIALLGRFGIAAVFWKSGQTKVEGFKLDLFDGTFVLGWPRLADSTVDLFRDEYKVPLLPPEVAAVLATIAEHVFPGLLLVGLATRLSAFGLLVMTAVIQVFVYPAAYPTHLTWATILILLMSRGPGAFSIDRLIARQLYRESSDGFRVH